LDGARGYWNGHAILSRHGKIIECPKWFVEGLMSDVTLDGELWLGRGNFDLVAGLLNSKEDDLLWKSVSFMILTYLALINLMKSGCVILQIFIYPVTCK
jgi:DNA ligase-1